MLYKPEGIHSLCREIPVAGTTATRKTWTENNDCTQTQYFVLERKLT
jgi:hypothetical protein